MGGTALVTAASGSIGTWLVPMLTDAGVTLVAAAHGRAKTDLATERGADVVVDYCVEDWTSKLPEVDVVFDGAGGDLGAAAFELVRPGGRFFSYGAAAGDFPDVEATAAERGIEVIGMDADFTADDMHRAMEEVAPAGRRDDRADHRPTTTAGRGRRGRFDAAIPGSGQRRGAAPVGTSAL